jgi:hypothetical protein
MKLKSFGCSFIFGSELSDNPESLVIANPVNQFSHLTWPALLAQKEGYGYDCHARPGSGNLQIAERVLNQCSEVDSEFFIIGWTYIDRFDYIGPWDMWQPWRTIVPGDHDNLSTTYYQNLHSEYKDKLSTLIYIKTVIDTLIEKNIKFIMTYIDDLMFDQNWHSTPATIELQSYIKPYMTTFDGLNFLDWSQQRGFAIGKFQHPLEPAHAAAANYMLELGVHRV